MARPSTTARVHEAVLALATEVGARSLTMEGVAARAGVGKQTLYRTWPSTSALVFDALLARSIPDGDVVTVPDTGDLRHDLEVLLHGAIAEITAQPNEALLRGLAADIQSDETMAAEFRRRLLDPQLNAIHTRLRRCGVDDPPATAELLLAPVFYRWFLRARPMPPTWVSCHVRRVMVGVTAP